MYRIFRLGLLLLLVLSAILFCMVSPALLKPVSVPGVFVRVRNGLDTYIFSLIAENPGTNTVFSPKSLPNYLNPFRIFISPNGQWLFVPVPPANNKPQLYYMRTGRSILNPPIAAITASVSADSRYLFYIAFDAAGKNETFNFLNLLTGQKIELVVAPLTSLPPGSRLPQNAIPAIGWTLKNKRITFVSASVYPANANDLNGFFTLDLSDIDLQKAGTYLLLGRTEIPPIAHHISLGTLSPDETLLAYIFLPDHELGDYFLNSSNGLAILDLAAGSTNTVRAAINETITNFAWADDSKTLVFVKRLEESKRFQFYRYDVANRQSTTLPITVQADVSNNYDLQMLLCGKTLFYVEYNTRHTTTLHSINLDDPTRGTGFFTADRIDLLSCAPNYAWNAAEVTVCDPYCTSTPRPPDVGWDDANIMKLDLAGGSATSGKQLSTNLGCAACHLNPGGPAYPYAPTVGTYARIINVRLKDPANSGKTPEQYIAESILRPDAYVVPGSPPGIMPGNYGNLLDLQELRDLVAYMMTQ